MAEQKHRTVVCDIHGLRYDPALSAGCARCRREGLVPRPQSKFLPLLLAMLAFTLIAARLVTAILDDRNSPQTEETAVREGVADPRIDPEPYRVVVAEVDRALYPDRAVDLSLLATRAKSGSEAVAAELARRGQTAAAVAVRGFAVDLGNVDLDARGLDAVRNRWYELQRRFFLPASWQVAPGVQAFDDPAVISAFTSFASELGLLVNEAAADGIEDDWIARLDALELRMPPSPPFDADSALLLGFRALQDGLAAARRAGSRPDSATEALEEAQRALDETNSQFGELSR